MRRFAFFAPFAVGLAAIVLVVGVPSIALGEGNQREFRANADGFHEILPNVGSPGTEAGAINTDGRATLRTTLTGDTIEYRFEFSGLTSNLVQAHYHFSQPHVSGGIMVFLCTNLGNGPAGTPPCPNDAHGTVSGVLHAADVIGPLAQNLQPGDLASVERAIRNGAAYLNLHTVKFPTGEIRGQLSSSNGNQE